MLELGRPGFPDPPHRSSTPVLQSSRQKEISPWHFRKLTGGPYNTNQYEPVDDWPEEVFSTHCSFPVKMPDVRSVGTIVHLFILSPLMLTTRFYTALLLGQSVLVVLAAVNVILVFLVFLVVPAVRGENGGSRLQAVLRGGCSGGLLGLYVLG